MKAKVVITLEGTVNPGFRFIMREEGEAYSPEEDWRIELAEALAELLTEGPEKPQAQRWLADLVDRNFTGDIKVTAVRDDGVEVTYP